MFKNVASQKVAVYAFDTATSAAKSGDAANITAQISKDGAAGAATDDVNPVEIGTTGVYVFTLLQAETNADLVVVVPVSSTSDVQIDPVIAYTVEPQSALNDLSAAQVNAEVVDALTVDTIAELAQAAPAATPTIVTALMLLYMNERNKSDQSSSLKRIYNDAGTVISKAAVTDSAGLTTREELVSGP